MKIILKTMPTDLDMKYNDTYNSQANLEIRRRLVPELIKSMKPNYKVKYDQINNWLKSLHKSRRSRRIYANKGRIDADNRRIHTNGRISEV